MTPATSSSRKQICVPDYMFCCVFRSIKYSKVRINYSHVSLHVWSNSLSFKRVRIADKNTNDLLSISQGLQFSEEKRLATLPNADFNT